MASRALIVDPYMGAAGDMFIGALVGLGVDFSEALELLSDVGDVVIDRAPEGYRVSTHPKIIELGFEDARNLVNSIARSLGLEEFYRDFAVSALNILVDAETWAHETFGIGKATHLHEASDIVLDLILTAYGLQKLGIKKIYCLYPIRVGGGIIRFSHGVFEAPAPATRWIIDRYMLPTKKGPYNAELLTPTGAAIIAALQPVFMDRRDLNKNFLIEKVGVGLGHKELPELNSLKIYVGLERNRSYIEEVVELETTIDDVAPEYISYIYDALEAHEVTIIPAVGKKNRLTMILRVLCPKDRENECVEKIFRVTGTLGIRRRVIERYVRPRRYKMREIVIEGHVFRVIFKEGKPEFFQILEISKRTGLTPLEILRRI